MEITLKNIPAPNTEKAAYIAPNATIAGDVTIGSGSSVWFGAVIRGDGHSVRIGENVNIQDNCLLHGGSEGPIEIGDRVTVGHCAIVHACTIEDDVLVGMHATVLSGAVVGKGSLIAAGAVVKENALIPPHSLVVGVPGVVKATLSPEKQKDLEINWKEYCELAQLYRESAKE